MALRLLSAGHHVSIGSRSQDRADQAVERATATLAREVQVDGAANEEAVVDAEVVVVTVPFAGMVEIYRSIAPSLRPGQVVLDATSPLMTAVGGRPWEAIRPWQGSAAEVAALEVPDGVPVVARAAHDRRARARGPGPGRRVRRPPVCRRRRGQATGRRTGRLGRGHAVGRCRSAGERAPHGAVDGPGHLHQPPLQGEGRRVPHQWAGGVGRFVTEGSDEPEGDPGRLVRIDDTSLWVAERGPQDGLPLLILHGGPGLDHHEFADYLDPLSDRGIRMVLVDQRAQGRSEPCDPTTWTLERHAQDVIMLARAMRLQRYAVLGHSYGAFVALQNAVDYPGMTAATIISCGRGRHAMDGPCRTEPAGVRARVAARTGGGFLGSGSRCPHRRGFRLRHARSMAVPLRRPGGPADR